MYRANDQIGPYTLVRRLGQGASGLVWLAERRGSLLTTEVALKVPFDDEANLESINREAQVWRAATGHPNVLPVIEADSYDGQVIIVSEYAYREERSRTGSNGTGASRPRAKPPCA